MRRGRLITIIGAIFAVVGFVLVSVAVTLAVTTASFLGSAERVDGIVVEMTVKTSTSRDSNGRTRESVSWYPTVEFTVDGRRHSFRSSTGTNPPMYEKGDVVPVAYDPGDPSDAMIAAFWPAFLAPVIVGGLGVLFTPVGVVLFVKGRRSPAR
ncbi:DUF3592 domain-containing protein [Nonomuraea sp. FMUSA5-5]|uniref:DUF3592 domain-containing protein n=1 Tax=Nonomuraea composti TaxID=2720023 RepID=A0ABX1BGB3_9ACTN|nr:DUF3592 domain-containing protein [Nonomuraea sp. FMUSA5-5]NJP95527.1 DUF3592 domain-containing protein [Nonomuraea sp. FMUSA5-5]